MVFITHAATDGRVKMSCVFVGRVIPEDERS
jgi:hypothetical protein